MNAARRYERCSMTAMLLLLATSSSALHTHTVRVRNLPFTVAIDSVEAALVEALPMDLKPEGCLVKPVDKARARDRGKEHGGSAWLSFATSADAAAAAAALDARALFDDFGPARCAVEAPRPPPAPAPPPPPVDAARRALRADARRRANDRRRADRAAVVGRVRVEEPPTLVADTVAWPEMPAAADPGRGGRLRGARASRKRVHVEAFLAVLPALLAGGGARVVDVGCGTGNLAAPLAEWYDVVAVDVNAEPLRLLAAREPRVECVEADAAALVGGDLFGADAVVSLHACGAVSDLALDAALERGAPFAISPCCLGKLLTDRAVVGGRMPRLTTSQRAAAPEGISYPRSSWLGLSERDYRTLAAAADYGVGAADGDDVVALQKRAKRAVETDRLAYAEERYGFATRLVDLPTDDARYPKRELLLGAPAGTPAAEAIGRLRTT